MSNVHEALDACVDAVDDREFVKLKSSRKLIAERNMMARTILRFLENVDEDLSVMEVRQALEDIDTTVLSD